MKSRLTKYIFSYMRENDIKASPELADSARVGYQWLRALQAKSGVGNPNSAMLERLHDLLVANHGMRPVIFIADDVDLGKSDEQVA